MLEPISGPPTQTERLALRMQVVELRVENRRLQRLLERQASLSRIVGVSLSIGAGAAMIAAMIVFLRAS